MLTSPRIIIASAYGRGHWLSVELRRQGFNVQLLDATKHLGDLKPEDMDGPFGVFASPRWHGIENEALNSLGDLEEAPNGFSLWLKSGPWELRGSTSRYRGDTLKQQERVFHFVEHQNELTADRKVWIQKLSNLDFEQRWFGSLASDLLANQSQWPNEAFSKSVPVGLTDRFFARRPETFNINRSLKWCEDNGVVVVPEAQIPDVAIEHRRIQGLEISSVKSGFARCHHLVWMLTSSETARVSPRAFLKLFEGKKTEPEWVWMRYELEFENVREVLQLPKEFLLSEDIHIPWAHDNYVLFRQGLNPLRYDAWLRLPHSQRFHREYIGERIIPVLQHLQSRCSRLKTKVLQFPREAEGLFENAGAPLFAQYRTADLQHPAGISLGNLWWSHPERWASYAWPHIFASQTNIISGLRRWWGEMSDEQKQKELQL